MPFVKVPGFDREIWVDLHEPTDTGTPWFVSAGQEITLTPEKFAAEYATGGFDITEVSLKTERLGRTEVGLRVSSALRYEKARKKLITGHSGRRRGVFGFTDLQDFVLIALYFESLGHKQAIRHALTHWALGEKSAPSRRHIDLAIKDMRNWFINDLFKAADLARARQGLPPIPTSRPIRKGSRKN